MPKASGCSRPVGEGLRGGADTRQSGSAGRDGPARPQPLAMRQRTCPRSDLEATVSRLGSHYGCRHRKRPDHGLQERGMRAVTRSQVNCSRHEPGACTCRDQAVPSGVLSMPVLRFPHLPTRFASGGWLTVPSGAVQPVNAPETPTVSPALRPLSLALTSVGRAARSCLRDSC